MDGLLNIWVSGMEFLDRLGGPKAFGLGMAASVFLWSAFKIITASSPKRLESERVEQREIAKDLPTYDGDLPDWREAAATPPPDTAPSEPSPPAQNTPAPDYAPLSDAGSAELPRFGAAPAEPAPAPPPSASAPAWREPIGRAEDVEEELDFDEAAEYRAWRREREDTAGAGLDGLLEGAETTADDDVSDLGVGDGAQPGEADAPDVEMSAFEPDMDLSDVDFHGATQAAIPPAAPLDDSPAAADQVACTVFGPDAAQIGEDLLIQAVIHPEGASVEAEAVAKAADPAAEQRVETILSAAVAHGQTITVSLELPGAEVEPARQSIVWRGETTPVQFAARFDAARPAGSSLAKLRVYIDDLPVAMALWRIEVQSEAVAIGPSEPVQAIKYERVFVSYASEDREAVLKGVQSLNAAGVEVFVDLLSLDPGVRWEQKLYEHIDQADAFFLFWSHHSATSEWVEKEWRYALARAERTDDGAPDIRPIILDAPPPRPPAELASLHFNDAAAYVAAALAAQDRDG